MTFLKFRERDLRKQSKSLLLALAFALLPFLSAQAAETGALFAHRDGIFDAQLTQSSANPRVLEFTVKGSLHTSVSVFALQNPPRIAIDFKNQKLTRDLSFAIPENQYLSSVRFGKHPDKTRVVFDFKGKISPSYSWNETRGTFIFSLKNLRNLQYIASPIPPANVPESTREQQIAIIPEPAIKETEKKEIVKNKQDQANTDSSVASLKKEITVPLLVETVPERAIEIDIQKTKILKTEPTTPELISATSRSETLSAQKKIASEISSPKEKKSILEEKNQSDTPSPLPVFSAPDSEPLNSKKESLPELQMVPDPAEDSTRTSLKPEMHAQEPLTNSPPAEISYPAEATPRGPTLQKIDFLGEGGKNSSLQFTLSDKSEYRLSRISNTSYRLFFPEAHISGPHLELPYLPPHSFQGIRLIETKNTLEGVEILISTETGYRLQSVRKGNSIQLPVRK